MQVIRGEFCNVCSIGRLRFPHSLGREEAMRRLKTGLSRAASSVPVLKVDEERWRTIA